MASEGVVLIEVASDEGALGFASDEGALGFASDGVDLDFASDGVAALEVAYDVGASDVVASDAALEEVPDVAYAEEDQTALDVLEAFDAEDLDAASSDLASAEKNHGAALEAFETASSMDVAVAVVAVAAEVVKRVAASAVAVVVEMGDHLRHHCPHNQNQGVSES